MFFTTQDYKCLKKDRGFVILSDLSKANSRAFSKDNKIKKSFDPPSSPTNPTIQVSKYSQ